MRAHSHSPFATALLLVPILAIPLLAIFGVPQLTPLVPPAAERTREASSARRSVSPFPEDSRTDWPELDDAARRAADSAWNDVVPDPTARAIADRRAEGVRPRPAPLIDEAAPARVDPAVYDESSGTGSDAPHHAATLAADASDRRAPPRRVSAPPPSRSAAAGGRSAAAPLTWQTAVRRLNELEIRNFRLEPGQQPEQFVFICSYTPQDNPRVSFRFEAEADEPLRAVEKVLAQIDAWLASR
jgi:hypothetical protein